MSDDRKNAARENLLRELGEISYAVTRDHWTADNAFQCYAVMVGDSDELAGKKLANPIMAHIDALESYCAECGEWPAAQGADSFVPLEDWKGSYEAWKAKRKGSA